MCACIVKKLLEIWSPAFGFISYKLKYNVLLFLGLGNWKRRTLDFSL
jgi:hypothetical protein